MRGCVYVCGGITSSGRATRLVERFDVIVKKWENSTSMLEARAGHAGAVLSSSFYVCGGDNDTSNGAFTTAEKYVLASDRWERLPNMNSPRSLHSAAAGVGRLFVCGGEDMSRKTLSSCACFSTRTGKWQELPDMP